MCSSCSNCCCFPPSRTHKQAVAQLPALTCITSLTPLEEPLRVNPVSGQQHPGLDPALLCCRSCLVSLDLPLLRLEHLASVSQCTALRQLHLRQGECVLVCVLLCALQWVITVSVPCLLLWLSITHNILQPLCMLFLIPPPPLLHHYCHYCCCNTCITAAAPAAL